MPAFMDEPRHQSASGRRVRAYRTLTDGNHFQITNFQSAAMLHEPDRPIVQFCDLTQ